jgi:nucleoside triphosphate pyrophosphatase
MTNTGSGNPPGLVLASSSPRRQSLLKDAGFQFTVVPADLDEKAIGGTLAPIEMAEKLALAKAEFVAPSYADHVVLAADTIVALGDIALGKPSDAGEARAMLQLLSGTTQLVITAVCVLRQSASLARVDHVISAVRMAPLTSNEIERYLATNQWQGKAGGYGIQDPDPFVERVRGCRTNIVGLPMKTTARLLESAGIYPIKS